ncbi:MAG: TonB family protein [Fulvimarina manganoxydans]|uniref:cell envelope integrity protein TolA n=1 Tax=Fulvimarina manganoxydans TaxID=937218 RepID=UPI002353F041|nr:TonB family protein [Fulvimarina manganoxydans]MCK5932301.1 TonB family protein [Fulvimarina manganoxydans]
MAFRRRSIAIALILSLAIHTGVAAWLTSSAPDEKPMMEGGPGVAMAVSGDPFDALAEGEETSESDVAPVEQASETVEAEMPTETAQPDQSVEAAKPVAPSETATAERAPDIQPDDANEAQAARAIETVAPQPAQPLNEVEAAPGETAEVAETLQSSEAQEIAAIEPQAPPAAPVTESVEAMEPQPDNVPLPTRRPNPPPRRVVEETPERTRPTRQRTEPQRTQQRETRSGNRGRQETNAQRGSRESGRAQRSGGGASGANATAARSNYSGQILSRIRRAQRYPASARRQRAEGTASVAFTVTGRGGASGIRLVRSSGNALIDRAAVDTIRRASPFPPIPREAGRSSMSFTVPIRFQLR